MKKSLPLSQVYKLLEPGPVVIVTTSYKNKNNIMTMSWHTMIDFEPPLVGCVISNRNYSFAILNKTKECVINIPTVDLIKKVVACGNSSGRKIDKFKKFHLTAKSATKIKAPLIEECYANLECKIIDTHLLKKYSLFAYIPLWQQLLFIFLYGGKPMNSKYLKIIYCFNLLNMCAHIQAYTQFNSLNSIRDYMQTLNESPKASNDDWADPDYSQFHLSLQPGRLKKFAYKLGLVKSVGFDAQDFKTILTTVTTQRKNDHLSGRFVSKLACSSNTDIYIWGDVHGSFHSLVRGLLWLHEQGIIDQLLTISKPNVYFVFNGDFIDRSPFTLETIMVGLRLLEQNPDRVFYVRGTHEDQSQWLNYGLKRELIIRTQDLPGTNKEEIPLKKELNEFFDTLPLALYVYESNDPTNVIRISHRDRQGTEVDEAQMGNFFVDKAAEYDITKRIKTTTPITIDAIIKTEDWRHGIRARNGLGFLEQDRGATAWAVLSSPIVAHQEFFDFYFDAFAKLIIQQPITQSTITLYNRDIRTHNEFDKVTTYNVVSGKSDTAPQGKSDGNVITLGSTMSLIQGVPSMGQRTKRGISILVNKINEAGGIDGKLLKTIIYNDNYIPALAIKNVNQLREQDKTDIIIMPTGTPTVEAFVDLVRDNKISVIFPITGNPTFRDPALKGFVHFRASYGDEVRALIDHIIKQKAARKFAFFYQDDSYGIPPLEVAHEELKKRGITNWIDVPYQRNSLDFSEQAKKIKLAQPDAIGLFSTAYATRNLIREIGIDFFTNKEMFGI